MHKLRVAAAATVIALIGAFASMGSASAATNGVGTTETQSSLVDVALGNAGSLLHLKVLGDSGKTTVDPAVGPISALSELSALNITSSVLPVLNNISLPVGKPWQALANSANPTASTPVGINLGTALNGILGQSSLPVVSGLGGAVLSGVLSPGNLTGSIADGTSKSGMNLSLGDLNLVGGLLTTHAVSDTLGAQAAGVAADGSRGLNVDAISVLNLGALLRGLGIDPANLLSGQVTSLLDNLGVALPISGVGAGQLSSLVASLQTTITGLTGTSGAFSALPSGVQGTVNGALGGVTGIGSVPTLGGLLNNGAVIPSTDVTSLLTTATNLLKGILPAALNALDGISLLQLNGIQLGAVTHAVNGTNGSTASVISKIGGVKVAGIDLGAVDLTGALSTVTNLVNTVGSTVDNALAPLGLDGILHLGLFEKYSNNGVSTSGGYTRALAGITGVNLSINPPAGLLGIVNGLNAPGTSNLTSIGEQITSLGSTGGVPVVGGLMQTLNSALPSASGLLGALAGGASIKVADISSGSNFAAPSAATPAQVSTLPRTGANTTAMLVVGFMMVGGVLVTRRFMVVRQHAEK